MSATDVQAVVEEVKRMLNAVGKTALVVDTAELDKLPERVVFRPEDLRDAARKLGITFAENSDTSAHPAISVEILIQLGDGEVAINLPCRPEILVPLPVALANLETLAWTLSRKSASCTLGLRPSACDLATRENFHPSLSITFESVNGLAIGKGKAQPRTTTARLTPCSVWRPGVEDRFRNGRHRNQPSDAPRVRIRVSGRNRKKKGTVHKSRSNQKGPR